MDNRRIVGDYLADHRVRRGLTQLDVGRALGMRDTAVSAIELGRNSLPPERYGEMADVLGVERRAFMKFVLRYYNPWAFSMLFPKELPASEIATLPERLNDLRKGLNHGLDKS
jgi:transcriptional regulator with XRE-family HTH domain